MEPVKSYQIIVHVYAGAYITSTCVLSFFISSTPTNPPFRHVSVLYPVLPLEREQSPNGGPNTTVVTRILKDNEEPTAVSLDDGQQSFVIRRRVLPRAPPSATPESLPVFNILLLGPTQSGKSSLLEGIKGYADSGYVTNTTYIGNGNKSHTQYVRVEMITTSLPTYKLYDGEHQFHIPRFLEKNGPRSFKKLIGREDELELWEEEVPGSTRVQFKIFDTPGLDDTDRNDIQNIARTFSALKGTGTFHQILILDSPDVPLLPSQEDAYRAYFELFKELHSLIAIVHTHVKNDRHYPGMNSKFDAQLSERSKFFNEIMGCKIPTVRVDCDLDETGQVHSYLMRETIRELLQMATKQSVPINGACVHKALVMLPVDKRVYQKYKDKLDSTIQKQEGLQERILAIVTTGLKIKRTKRLIRQHDTDELIPVYEKRYKEEWGFFRWPKEVAMEFPEQDLTIDKVVVSKEATEVRHEVGGEGKKSWEVKFKRHFFESGHYSVTVSVTRRNKCHKDIEAWRRELGTLTTLLETQVAEYNLLRQKLEDMESGYTKILKVAAATKLHLDMFMELAEAGVYQGSDVDENAAKLEGYLKEKWLKSGED